MFTACGGDSSKPPPPVQPTAAQPNPADQQAQAALQHWVQQGVGDCSHAACEFAQQNIQNIVPGYAAYGGQPGAMPVGYPQQGGQPGFNTTPTPSQGACQFAVRQVMMNVNTMGNGTYSQRPDVQQYLQTAFFQPIGSNVSQCVPPLFNDPQYMQNLVQLGSTFSSQVGLAAGNVPPWAMNQIQGQFNAQISSLSGGYPH